MFVIAVGVSHKKAPIQIRETLAFSSDQLLPAFHKLKATGKIAGCVILSTCNRTEIYAASRDADAAISEIWQLIAAKSSISVEQLQTYSYSLTCQHAMAHLFKVAAGIDSMILGETQILGQVADAYQIACDNSATNSVLNTLFQKALKVGKQVRTQTRIGEGASSVGSAAVELARQAFGDIQSRSVLLIGAGEIGRLVARNLASNVTAHRHPTRITVCNRSYDKAQELASEFGGRAAPFERLDEYLARADLVVSCTAAPGYIITKQQLASLIETRHGKPIFLIDLAVPRDIEPGSAQLERLYLYNVDDLQAIVHESLSERKSEAQKAESIIQRAVDNFIKWLNSRSAVPVIKALCSKREEIKNAELEKAIRKLGPLTEREEKILHSLANSIASKLTNTPIVQLRQYAQTEQGHLYAQVLRDLYDLPVNDDDQKSLPQVQQQPDPQNPVKALTFSKGG